MLFNNAVSTAAVFSFELCDKMIAFRKCERTGEEAVMSCFKVLSQSKREGPEEKHESSHDSQRPGRDSNLVPPRYKSEASPLE
jgi:hypothetical protein